MKTSIIKKTGIIIFWLLVWALSAGIINNNILLVGPHRVIISFFKSMGDTNFILIVLNSTLRIGAGFLSALILACIFGALSYRFALFNDFIKPLVYCMKTVPVASFVVILLIWSGASYLSLLISFIITFPSIYTAVVDGLRSTDEHLLSMSRVFKYSFRERLVYLYRDAVMPYLISASRTALGLAWKSGVAAEVIGLPRNSLGERVYMSKIYLDTEGLFSWTLWVIVLSFGFEKLIIALMKAYSKPRKAGIRRGDTDSIKSEKNMNTSVNISDISVTYDGRKVLDSLDVNIESSGRKAIIGPSGAGKTTLLKEISKRAGASVSIVFQENRLLENYDAKTNVLLGKNALSYDRCIKILEELLPGENLDCPLIEYSGGMKRRVALARALCHVSGLLLLDEPFTGMDDNTKARCVETIKEELDGRILVLVSHNKDDVAAFEIEEKDRILLYTD